MLITAILGLAAGPAHGIEISRLIAPSSACKHQGDRSDPVAVQDRAMRCMTDYARERRGLAAFADFPALDRAARRKAADILRCDEFSHEA